jgi:hypothetical protein
MKGNLSSEATVIVVQIVKKSSTIYELEDSLPYSQVPATLCYHVTNTRNSNPHTSATYLGYI